MKIKLKQFGSYCRHKRIHVKILFELYKNFKLIFRNWSSLLLIVLAPLFLILLVGYSFSSDTLHDIKIGVNAIGDIDLDEFAQNVSSFGKVIEYNNTERCLIDLALQRNHLCLEIIGSFTAEKGEIPTGEVKFYYDNTRKKISLMLLSELKDYFGLTSERISLISTQEIFDNIQQFLNYINEGIEDMDDIKFQAEQIEDDLRQRKKDLMLLG